ncbi:MAG: hypothetical protein WAW42_20900 [Candidatus Competibacteraceae bacterium]
MTQERIKRFLRDRHLVGDDVLKKLMIFNLPIKKTIRENEFFPYLMTTYWFKETVDFYFNSDYETKYQEILRAFFIKGIIKNRHYQKQ